MFIAIILLALLVILVATDSPDAGDHRSAN